MARNGNMARLNSDGSVDPSFDPGSGPDDTVRALLLQPDGKIIIGGKFFQLQRDSAKQNRSNERERQS